MKFMSHFSQASKALTFAGLCLFFTASSPAQKLAVNSITDPNDPLTEYLKIASTTTHEPVQAVTAADPYFILREYMKIEPGMETEYLKTEATWKKVHQRRKTEGKIVDWVLYRRLFPSGSNMPYSYMTITVFKSGKELEEATNMTWDYIVKGMSAEDLAIGNNTEKTRSLVSRSLDQQIERVQPGTTGRFVKLTQVKVVAGQGAELKKHEKMMEAVFIEAVKMGKIGGWRFGAHIYPNDPNTGGFYRAINTNTLEEMVNNESNGYLEMAFKKVYPTKDYAATMKMIRETIISYPMEEIWERVDKID